MVGGSFPMLDGRLSLVIPAHNESANMAGLLPATAAALAQLAKDWEIILVDDGSTDATGQAAAKALGEAASRLRVIRHNLKLGYGITVADGLRAARGNYVAFMDGDGQFDPNDLVRLAELMAIADLAAGWRERRGAPSYRLGVGRGFHVPVRFFLGIPARRIDSGAQPFCRGGFAAAP